MKRIYSQENKPLSFKAAFCIVIAVHAFGAAIVIGPSKVNSNDKTTNDVIQSGPYSDSLERNFKPIKHSVGATEKNKPQKSLTNKTMTAAVINKEKNIEPISPTPTEYTLLPGDNFYAVSRKLNVPFSVLADYNNIKDVRTLRVGQVIKVPQQKG